MGQLENKTIIVTGASQGLGKAITDNILFNYLNSEVVLVARNKQLLLDYVANLPEHLKDRVLTVAGDVTNEETIEMMVSDTLQKFGKIDGVVFNAGIIAPVGHLSDPEKYDIGGMKRLFDVNYFSIVVAINRILMHNEKDHPIKFIFVSSGASTRGIDGWLAYGSSKAAVNQLCKQLHDEMYPQVKCISVAPGVVRTSMQTTIRETLKDKMTPESHQRFVQLNERDKLLDPMVVGRVYARLALEDIPARVCGEYVRWDAL